MFFVNFHHTGVLLSSVTCNRRETDLDSVVESGAVCGVLGEEVPYVKYYCCALVLQGYCRMAIGGSGSGKDMAVDRELWLLKALRSTPQRVDIIGWSWLWW